MKGFSKSIQQEEGDLPPLTKGELAELKRRIADSDDPTRYVVVSPFSKRFCLYYCAGDGHFIMNEIPDEALFKRRAVAVAVARVVEGRRRRRLRGSLQVIAVRKTKKGIRILEKVRSPWGQRDRWKPALRKRVAPGSKNSSQEPRPLMNE
jgi:hypothetical protein